MTNYGRRALPRVEEQSASFEIDGVFAAADWRYELLLDYLQLSPSYQALSKTDGEIDTSVGLPSDAQRVQEVFADFGNIRRIGEARWWSNRGKALFGIKAPEPAARSLGRLTTKDSQMVVKWTGVDELVVTLPLGLTRNSVLKKLSKLLAEEQFAQVVTPEVEPKYALYPSKLRKETLVSGIEALKMYRRQEPLWRIGNKLRVVPAQCFDERDAVLNPRNYNANKIVLSIAARRLIRCSILVAENAARGRFPCNKSFPEAMLEQYQRKAGRPVGSRGPKRKKAG
ncbi:MAG: hypothetical protein RLY14_1290 [Planctomycetota bacterium]|jgi:hypothetical protein